MATATSIEKTMRAAIADVGRNKAARHVAVASSVLKRPDQFVSTGSWVLDRLIAGKNPGGIPIYPHGCIVHIAGEWSTGKAVSGDTPVLTPNGFVCADEVHVGDRLIGADGKPTRVDGVFPQGPRSLFRVTFNDGASVDVDGDHLWSVGGQRECHRVMTTLELREHGLQTKAGLKWSVPWAKPVQYAAQSPLPLDPYVLGVLIGDGCLTLSGGVAWSKPSKLVTRHVARRMPIGFGIRTTKLGLHHSIVSVPYAKVNGVRKIVTELGLAVRSPKRFVPDAYQLASPKDRLALLQGLFDTDGTPSGPGVDFCVTSRRLAEDVVSLVRSLGGWASEPVKGVASYKVDEKRKITGSKYRVYVRLPDSMPPFLAEKKAKLARGARYPIRRIVSIEPKGKRQAVCFRVAARDSLFVVKDFIVTHNSLWFDHVAKSVIAMGGHAYVSEIEGSRDRYFAERIGLNLDKVAIDLAPDTLEAAFENFLSYHAAFRKTDKTSPIIYALDSLASGITDRGGQDMRTSGGYQFGGGVAGAAGAALKKIVRDACAHYPTSVLIINQLRDNVGVMFGPKKRTPGGNAPHFYASFEIMLAGSPRPHKGVQHAKYNGQEMSVAEKKRLGIFGDLDGGIEGRWIRGTVSKSKLASTFGRWGDFYLDFSNGVHAYRGLLDMLRLEGVVELHGKRVTHYQIWYERDAKSKQIVLRRKKQKEFASTTEWGRWIKENTAEALDVKYVG